MSQSQFNYFVTRSPTTDHAVANMVRSHRKKKTGACPQTPIKINLE